LRKRKEFIRNGCTALHIKSTHYVTNCTERPREIDI
jgi:hypothetical protein